MSRIVSFRGLMTDLISDTVNLHSIDGSVGYRVKTFKLIGEKLGTVDQESVVKIYKVPQTTIDSVVDFSDPTLLGVGYFKQLIQLQYQSSDYFESVLFDNEIFNQDIYITHKDNEVGESINYYMELEQMPLDLNENTVATLKDIRNITRTV